MARAGASKEGTVERRVSSAAVTRSPAEIAPGERALEGFLIPPIAWSLWSKRRAFPEGGAAPRMLTETWTGSGSVGTWSRFCQELSGSAGVSGGRDPEKASAMMLRKSEV